MHLPPLLFLNSLRGEKAVVESLTNQMLTLTNHLWGEESAFAHVPLMYSVHVTVPLLCGPGSFLRIM